MITINRNITHIEIDYIQFMCANNGIKYTLFREKGTWGNEESGFIRLGKDKFEYLNNLINSLGEIKQEKGVGYRDVIGVAIGWPDNATSKSMIMTKLYGNNTTLNNIVSILYNEYIFRR